MGARWWFWSQVVWKEASERRQALSDVGWEGMTSCHAHAHMTWKDAELWARGPGFENVWDLEADDE